MNVITGETGAGKTMVVTGLGLLFGGRADAGRVRAEPGPGHGRGPAAARRADRATAVHARDRRRRRRARRRRHAAAEPHGHRRGPVPGARRRPRPCRCDARPRSASRWSPCTASPTSCGCCARPSSAPRSTGSPAPSTRSCSAQLRERFAAWRAVADDLADRRRNARERNQEADLLRLGPRRDHPGRPAAGRGRRAARRGAAAGARRGPAHRRASSRTRRSPAAPRRATTRRTRRSCSAPRGARWRRRPTVDPALGELAGRLDRGGDPGRRRRRRAVRPTWRALDADPARLQDDLRAAGRAARADPQVRRRRRRRDRLGRPRPDPAGRAGHLRRAARGAGPGAAAARRRGGRAGRPRLSRVAPVEAAERFADEVTVELAGLAMPHARVEVAVLPRPAGRGEPALTVDGVECGVGPDGADEVELRLLAHPGAPALPLQKGASGGELSRVMLAIEVVFAGVGRPADAGLRRGRRRGRRSGRGGDRPAAGPAGPHPPGAGGHAPAAGGRVRRPAPGGGEGHRRARSRPAGCGWWRTPSGPGSWPGCSPACPTPIWASPTPRSCWRWPAGRSAADDPRECRAAGHARAQTRIDSAAVDRRP